jgi:DNA-binding NarL/FixJ family response regulator
MIRVAIVSTRQLIRNLIRLGLQSLSGQCDGIEELSMSQETVLRCIAFSPNLVVLDLTRPRVMDFQILRELASPTATWALLLIVAQTPASILQALVHNRGSGVVTEESSLETLVHAAYLVASGGTYVDAAFSPLMKECIVKGGNGDLSQRERHVLQLIAQGYSTKEVADILKISVKTADKYRSSIMKKLNIHDVVKLVHWAIRLGLLTI